MSYNGTMMQYFHYYNSNDGTLWDELRNNAQDLAKKGITAIWMPPPYKGSGGIYDVGYGIYDLFDLGEFEQHGTVRTKYGTKEQFLAAVNAIHANGMQAYGDVVFNHKVGADENEEVEAYEVDKENRNITLSGPTKISVPSRFYFPGRGDKYSSMEWYWWCFDSVDKGDKIYRLKDKHFETEVSIEKGNFDYLLGIDLDTSNEFVQGELKFWGEWFLNTTSIDGFRIDAVKHIRASFFKEWLGHVRHYAKKNLFAVGEYLDGDIKKLNDYIGLTDGQMSLFDFPLHFRFQEASNKGEGYDMSRILEGTLLQQHPGLAVTFVENHDTQPHRNTTSDVKSWFKPLAYAFILLHKDGYPCIFYPDYYGANYEDISIDSHKWIIDKLLYARRRYAYGEQKNYFDHKNTIGWTRLGDDEHPKAMAVLMSNGWGGSKWMEVGRPNTPFLDLTGHVKEPVYTNDNGWGEFRCNGGSVSVWVEEKTSPTSGFRFSG